MEEEIKNDGQINSYEKKQNVILNNKYEDE